MMFSIKLKKKVGLIILSVIFVLRLLFLILDIDVNIWCFRRGASSKIRGD